MHRNGNRNNEDEGMKYDTTETFFIFFNNI